MQRSLLLSREQMEEGDAYRQNATNRVKRPSKNRTVVVEGKKNATGSSGSGKILESNRQNGLVLAQKMRELELMDSSNVEHVLDVEEALHYYSRLTSPDYLHIVNTFFVDMFADLFAPKSPASSVGSSHPRLGSPNCGG